MSCDELGWRKLSTVEALFEIEEAWQALNLQCGSVVFSSPAWLLNWISLYWQSDWQLEVWIYQQQSELVALFPVYSQPGAIATQRVLYPLGQGEAEEGEVASEFTDLLIAPGWQHLLPALAAKIKKSAYHGLSWRAVAADANVIPLVSRLRFAVIKPSGCRYQHLNTKVTALLSSQIQRKWQKILRYERTHNVKFSWLNSQQAIAIWPQLKELHQQRWNRQGKPGAFGCDVFNDFHIQLLHKHPQVCQMSLLTFDGEVAAVHYYIQSEGCLHFYQAGWATQYARWSPSAMLHLWSIQHSALPLYDFMMGGKNSYKAELSNVTSSCYQLDMYSGAIPYAVAMLKNIKQRMLR